MLKTFATTLLVISTLVFPSTASASKYQADMSIKIPSPPRSGPVSCERKADIKRRKALIRNPQKSETINYQWEIDLINCRRKVR